MSKHAKIEDLRNCTAGFTLSGWRKGTVVLEPTVVPDTSRVLQFEDWPKEVECNGKVYTLEDVVDYLEKDGFVFQNANYV